jgi:hypothetical protein
MHSCKERLKVHLFFASFKSLLFFIFYLAGGKIFQPTFIHNFQSRVSAILYTQLTSATTYCEHKYQGYINRLKINPHPHAYKYIYTYIYICIRKFRRPFECFVPQSRTTAVLHSHLKTSVLISYQSRFSKMGTCLCSKHQQTP